MSILRAGTGHISILHRDCCSFSCPAPAAADFQAASTTVIKAWVVSRQNCSKAERRHHTTAAGFATWTSAIEGGSGLCMS